MVFHLGLLDLIYLGPCQPGGCSEPVVHSATHSDRLGQMTTCSVLSRERGRCLDATSPGDLCGQSSQQFMLCSQPVPLLSWDSPWDSEAMTPPFTDGMCVCVRRETTWHHPSLAGLPHHVLFEEFGMSWDTELCSLGETLVPSP